MSIGDVFLYTEQYLFQNIWYKSLKITHAPMLLLYISKKDQVSTIYTTSIVLYFSTLSLYALFNSTEGWMNRWWLLEEPQVDTDIFVEKYGVNHFDAEILGSIGHEIVVEEMGKKSSDNLLSQILILQENSLVRFCFKKKSSAKLSISFCSKGAIHVVSSTER